jgi:Uma2 family endonuclease
MVADSEGPAKLCHDLRAGVREYWIVSPEAAIVEVLALEGGAYRLHVRAGGDETVTSSLLPELTFPASALFA